MKRVRLRKILIICNIIIFGILMLSISFNQHSTRPKETIYVSLCILPSSEECDIMEKELRTVLQKKANGFDLRLMPYGLTSGSQVEDFLLKAAQMQYDVICIINYINPGLHRKLVKLYPEVEFIFIGSFAERKILYEQLDSFFYRLRHE